VVVVVGSQRGRIGDRITNIVERIVFMTSGVVLELNPEPRRSRVAVIPPR